MWLAKRGSTVTAVAVVSLFMGACDQASSPVSPEAALVPLAAAVLPSVPASTPYPASQQPDRAIVCKDASSPAGTYTFSVSASPLLAGDQVASTATLAPGECAIVYNRTTTSASFTNVTIAEQIPQGASYQVNHVAVNDIDGPRNMPGPSVTLKVNQYHGSTANYFNESTGTPPPGLPQPTPYPASQQPDKGIVCKDASSPAGTYTFSISANNTLAGDQVATSATLSPGQCAIVYIRGTSSASFSTVTSTEVIPQGAGYQVNHIAVNDIDGPRNVTGPTTTLKVNKFHGSVADYFNEAAAAPPVPPGTVRVCKSGAVQGTFNLTAAVVGGVASDVITNNIALTAGSCANVFVRTQGGLPPATVTVTESLVANANTFLSGVTVNGVATATVGAAVVVQQDELVGKVVVFVNANATVGASVNYHPTTPTPGQVILCKSATSPAGTFNFAVTGVGTVGSDQITSNVSLSAGQCKTVFIRSTVEPLPATILVTEQLGLGVNLATVQLITATTNGFVNGAAGVAVGVNGGTPNMGNVLVFFNVGVNLP